MTGIHVTAQKPRCFVWSKSDSSTPRNQSSKHSLITINKLMLRLAHRPVVSRSLIVLRRGSEKRTWAHCQSACAPPAARSGMTYDRIQKREINVFTAKDNCLKNETTMNSIKISRISKQTHFTGIFLAETNIVSKLITIN